MPYKVTDVEYPEKENIPKELLPLLKIGKKQLEIDLFGWKWTFWTLEEWEEREIVKKYRNFDPYSLSRIRKIDILTFSIIKATRPDGTNLNFYEEHDKLFLRSFLLALDPKPLDEIYRGYEYLHQIALKEYQKQYPSEISELLRQLQE